METINMTIERVDTQYSNTYKLIDDTGKVLGFEEEILAGRFVGTRYRRAGTRYHSLSKYTSKELKELFRKQRELQQ